MPSLHIEFTDSKVAPDHSVACMHAKAGDDSMQQS